MASPRPTPLDEGSMQNMAREEIRFSSSVPVLTETEKDTVKLLTAPASDSALYFHFRALEVFLVSK